MKALLKTLVIVAAVGLLGYLFVRSVQETRAEPYVVRRAHLADWTFALEPGNAPNSVLLAVRPPREMGGQLFRQLFQRAAETMSGPSVPFVPLLLQDEFNRAFAGRATSGELLEQARQAGIDGSSFQPQCMAYRRDSAPGVTRQLYFVVFDAPAFTRFREAIAPLAIDAASYDPRALSPVMIVAASDADFNRWLPLQATPADCVAPISLE